MKKKSASTFILGLSVFLFPFLLMQNEVFAATRSTTSSTQTADTQAADLKTNAQKFGNFESQIDSLTSTYNGYFGLTQADGSDDHVYDISFNNGGNIYTDNVQSKWPEVSYSDLTAAQSLSYANDLCNSQVTLAQVLAKTALTDDEQKRFNNVRSKFCSLVKRAAKLKQRIDKYNAIKDNGIVLWQRYAKAKPSYSGYERTIQMGVSLKFYPFHDQKCASPDGDQTTTITPEYCNSNKLSRKTGTTTKGLDTLEEYLEYDSWLKWSDDGVTPLNLIKKFKDMQGGGSCKKFIPIKIIYGGSVTATLYLGVKSVHNEDITLSACSIFHYKGDDKSVGLGDITFKAPFGYLGQLEAMRDKAQDNVSTAVHNKIQDAVMKLLGNKSELNSMLYLIDQAVNLNNQMKTQI